MGHSVASMISSMKSHSKAMTALYSMIPVVLRPVVKMSSARFNHSLKNGRMNRLWKLACILYGSSLCGAGV